MLSPEPAARSARAKPFSAGQDLKTRWPLKPARTDSLATVPPAQVSVNDVTQSGPTAALAETAVGIFVVLTVLIWLLTYLGAHPRSARAQKRGRRLLRRRRRSRSLAEADEDYPA